MPAAPLPDDEAARLAELISYEILETPADPRFETFIGLAQQIYDVPIALVSLVDAERQWFKAAAGVGNVCETSRGASFCAWAILAPDQVMVVEDTAEDARFIDNPLVNGSPHIRFYAGAPILGAGGHALGTLCIIDTKPRRLDRPGRRQLASLATGVASMLELHRGLQQMQRAATHDCLTGLANRALFEPELEAAAQAALDGIDCAVLCLDLDRFKLVNDTYGHAIGDDLLRETARRLRSIIRPSDLAARLGGDEFAILMRGPFPPGAPQRLAERVLAAFAQPALLHGISLAIHSSIGHASTPPHRDGALLLRAADIALYKAKDLGRGSIVAASQECHEPADLLAAGASDMERDLRQALAAGAFELHWQPYFRAGSGQVEGFEALLRWDRPGHGPVSPAVFIPVAEASGLIVGIDAWVLEQACASASLWPVSLSVSVNVSPHWLCTVDVATTVASLLDRTALASGRLVLELTERTVINFPMQVRERIHALHSLGLRLALDDFGIGYSSLACIKDFAFDTLKLDGSFIHDIETQPRAREVARVILALGRALDMTVCAEGVETGFQLDFLRTEGCELVQGYLFGRPEPMPAFRPMPLASPARFGRTRGEVRGPELRPSTAAG